MDRGSRRRGRCYGRGRLWRRAGAVALGGQRAPCLAIFSCACTCLAAALSPRSNMRLRSPSAVWACPLSRLRFNSRCHLAVP